MIRLGPATSFIGSPTVSPTTAALCTSVPFLLLSRSISFFALSHAAPTLLKKTARQTLVRVIPMRRATRVSAPKRMPVTTGGTTASTPSYTISLKAFLVLMFMQRS
jgi:hypothetical protein